MIDGAFLDARAEEINDIIYSLIPASSEKLEYITEAVEYSIRAGGKRIRPMLIRETFRYFAPEQPEPRLLHAFMGAIEFIHSYSLVHDDLPAMDNDLFRRGRPATHAAYGEAFGILAGDALLSESFELVLRELLGTDDSDMKARGLKALYVLANKAGIRGMVGGQCLDVYSEKHPEHVNSFEDILFIYRNKTAALLEAAVMIGAILAGADDEKTAVMEQIAENVGFAFQIRDDILDIISTDEMLGKPVGSDDKNNKVTYVSLKGLEQAQKDVEEYSGRAAKLLEGLGGDNSFLEELVLFLAGRVK